MKLRIFSLFYMFIKYCSISLLLLFFFCFFPIYAAGPYTNDMMQTILSKIETYPINLHYTQGDYMEALLSNFTASTQNLDFSDTNPKRALTALITIYCSSVLSAGNFFDGELFYSPRQSAFMYLLCTNINSSYFPYFLRQTESTDGFSPSFTGYFKNSDFDRLNLSVDEDEKHLAYLYVDDLFNAVVSEYFSIKQANIYGLLSFDTQKMSFEKQANIFSSLYFKGIEICNPANKKFFSKKTCKYMVQYLKNVQKMLNNLHIFDVKTLFNDYVNLQQFIQKKYTESSSSFCSSANVLQGNYQLLLCGLRGDNSQKNLGPFVNLVYNELFYYNLFVHYLSNRFLKEPQTFEAWSKKDNNSVMLRTTASEQAKNIAIMQNEYAWSYDALKMSIRILRNAYVTYPLHIGFLMYREKLKDFGNALAKVVTPVYTLYDKFRNVQCPKK